MSELLLKERLCLRLGLRCRHQKTASRCALRSRTPATSGYRRSLDLLAETSLVPVDACAPTNPHNDLAVNASAAPSSFHNRHQDPRYRPPRYGPRPSRFERCHDALSQSSDFARPVSRPPPMSPPGRSHRSRPITNPSPHSSEQRPAARRLVSYRLDTRRPLRKTDGSVVLQRRPNLGRPHR